MSGAVSANPPYAAGLRRLEVAAVLAAIVFGILLFAAAAASGMPGALAALQSVDAGSIALMLALSLLNYALRALRWLLFSRTLGLSVPPARNALYFVAGFAMTATPGKLGEALRLWFLRRLHACRYAATASLLVADRLWDALAMVCVLCVAVAWKPIYLWVSLLAALLVAGIAYACLATRLPLTAIDYAAGLLPRRRRGFATLRRAIRPLRHLAGLPVFVPALLLGAAGWLAEGLSFSVVLHALGAHLPAMQAVFIFSFGMVVGAITLLPGGLGSTEATMVGLLSFAGVGLPTAIVAVALVRVTTLWFAVGLGMLALPVCLRMVRAAPAPA